MSASPVFVLPWLTCLVLLFGASPASAAMGVPIGKNGLPTTFAGEAITVGLAFALPALVAGLVVAAQRLAARIGRRGVVLLAGTTLGAITLWLWPDARILLAVLTGRLDDG